MNYAAGMKNADLDGLAKLTDRETEIALMIHGCIPLSEIAFRLRVSYQTLKNHQRAIYEKTGTGDHTQLGILVELWKLRAAGLELFPVEEWAGNLALETVAGVDRGKRSKPTTI